MFYGFVSIFRLLITAETHIAYTHKYKLTHTCMNQETITFEIEWVSTKAHTTLIDDKYVTMSRSAKSHWTRTKKNYFYNV